MIQIQLVWVEYIFNYLNYVYGTIFSLPLFSALEMFLF